MFAGPDGAEKTTFTREFLPNEGHCLTFINAYLIAADISPFAPEAVSVRASRGLSN
jgi:predicted ABC-type ATPase